MQVVGSSLDVSGDLGSEIGKGPWVGVAEPSKIASRYF